ncbi:alpha-N-arabinofuranosidase [Pedobacter aquatilis]|uniref:alpha-N-arabinofuranosidase n=1 Tax=Pedobacter aquatilis TaxID=351343 RepID=UPI002931E2F4|nr:alpha-L-arabinofuranosidase C-terminal domain-containing protein [Pedobacter aquatilis]
MRSILSTFLCALGLGAFAQTAKIEIFADADAPVINRHIYGFFTEHIGRGVYDGFYGREGARKDVVDALSKITPANIRWPGGRFAEDYHWRDGIGNISSRPIRVNKHWGNVFESNRFGTEEYLEFCKKVGSEPIIVANVQTGTTKEMVEWLRYLKGRTAYWHIGNQSWAYTDSLGYVSKFVEYAKASRNMVGGKKLKLIAVGPGRDNVKWTKAMMIRLPLNEVWGLSFHHYVFPMDASGKYAKSSSDFDEQEYFSAISQSLGMDSLIKQHTNIMDVYDPDKKVALVIGEWGVRVKDSLAMAKHGNVFQYGALRDALCAATMLNVFNNNSDRVRMANLAQTVNVLHSVILTEGDKTLKTPTYYVFNLMKVHQDAKLVPLKISSPKYAFNGKSMDAVNASASLKEGILNITLVNADPEHSIEIAVPVGESKVSAKLLTGNSFTSMNEFGKAEAVKLITFTDFKKKDGELIIRLPTKSIVQMSFLK